MLKNIAENHDDSFEIVIVFTGDHTTPVEVGDHTFEPVPFAMSTLSAIKNKL